MRCTTVLITFLIMSSCFISCLFTLPQIQAVTLSSPSVLVSDSTQLKTSIDVCTADDGRIYVLWSERDASGEDVFVSYSSNNGSTFSPAICVNNEANGNQKNPSMATDDESRLFVVWQDAYSDPGNIILSRSDDGGRTFQEIHVSNQEDGTQAYPDVAVNGNDVAIVWEEYRSDNTIRIWSGINGDLIRSLAGHVGAVRDVEYSPDSTRLASGAEDTKVIIWNPQNGNLVTNLTGHSEAVTTVNWSADGSMMATGSFDYDVIIWDTTTWDEDTRLNSIHNGTAEVPLMNPVNSLSFSPDGSQIAVAYNGKLGPGVPSGGPTEMFNITVWNLSDSLSWTVNENNVWHTKPVMDISFSHNGTLIASCSKDGTVNIWNSTIGEAGGVNQKVFLNDPFFATSASVIIPGTLNTGKEKEFGFKLVDYSGPPSRDYTFNVTIDNVTKSTSGASDPNDEKIIDVNFPAGTVNESAKVNVSVEMFSTTNWTLLDSWEGTMEIGWVRTVTLNTAVLSLAWSPDDTEITVGLTNGSVAVLNVTGGNVKYWLKGTHTGRVNSVAWHPGRYIASGAADPKAKVWDESSGTERLNLSTHLNSVYSIDWSTDGLSIVTAGGNSSQYQLGESQIFCAVSTDSGLTFSSPVIVTDTCSRKRWRPKIGMDANSDISIVWYDSRNDGKGDIYFANSTDLGATFSGNKGLSTVVGVVENTPEIAVEGNGKVHIIWQFEIPVSIRYANSGDNFQNSMELASDGQMPSIATSPTGTAVWAVWRQDDNSLVTSISYNNGVSFDDSTVVTPDSVHGSSVSVDAYNQTSLVWKSWPTIDHNIYYRGTVLTDTWGPSVTGSIPWDGQTDVSIFEPFTLNFSEPMHHDSVENAFSWTDGTTTWNADNCSRIDWNPYGDEVKFMPEIPLRYLVAEYSMAIDTTATDLAGNPLTSSYTISFTTSDDIDPPFIDHVLSMNEVNYDKEYVIWANITDQWGSVGSTQVHYMGVGSSTTVSLVMTNTGGSEYAATIPAQMVLGNVSYYIEAKDAFDNTATLPSNLSLGWFNYSVVDHTDPEINHVQSIEWPVNQQIDIWAVVLDEIELVYVELQYKGVSDTAFSSVPMQSNGSTNTYNCTIQAQYDIGNFQYRIEAVDGSDNVNTTVDYLMLITDLTKPEIIFVKTEHIANQTKVLIQANVTDDVELDEVTLYFRAVGGNRWVERPMQNVGGSLFEYTIPAQRNSGTIYYYVNATDTAGNVASTLEADQYYEIDVIGVGTDWTPYIILSVILIILMVVLIYQLSKRFGKGSEPGREMPTDDDFQTEEIVEPPEQLDEPQVDIEPESPEAEPEEPRVDA